MTDEDRPISRPSHEIGQPLDLLSVAEIDTRTELLKAEIARLEAAKTAKRAAASAAESFFRKAAED